MPKISTGDIEALVQMFERSQWKELELQLGDSELFLSKDAGGRASWETRGHGAAPGAPPSPASRAVPPAVSGEMPDQTTVHISQKGAIDAIPEGCVLVDAPSLGTFYRSAKPGAAPFVELGQQVDEETELCLIEVMKLFTTLRAGVSGTVREILVKDGDLVEFGQPLFLIDTNG